MVWNLKYSSMSDLEHLSPPEESRHTETIFRDKAGRKRDLVQERLEQQQKDEAKSERDEQYARWGRG